MFSLQNGCFRLFQFAGITVYLHWSWFLVAYVMITANPNEHREVFWNAAEYVTLFGIVLLHEFGHALACRQVGGRADRIMLWPLGGVAYVAPPARPGATLWSIAAGPLVNLALAPLTVVGIAAATLLQGEGPPSEFLQFALGIAWINAALLIFNLLPIYPLDGGQILYALLWFAVGRVAALRIVSVIGLVGGAAVALFGVWAWLLLPPKAGASSLLLLVIGLFMASRAWAGFVQARQLEKRMTAPRRTGWACPACGQAPLIGAWWGCSECGTRFDTFETRGSCPNCGRHFAETGCPECQAHHSLPEWEISAPSVAPVLAADSEG
jgi:Zn-dependent protease